MRFNVKLKKVLTIRQLVIVKKEGKRIKELMDIGHAIENDDGSFTCHLNEGVFITDGFIMERSRSKFVN